MRPRALQRTVAPLVRRVIRKYLLAAKLKQGRRGADYLMNIGIGAILWVFRVVLAIHEFQQRGVRLAVAFIIVGAALTTLRLKELRG